MKNSATIDHSIQSPKKNELPKPEQIITNNLNSLQQLKLDDVSSDDDMKCVKSSSILYNIPPAPKKPIMEVSEYKQKIARRLFADEETVMSAPKRIKDELLHSFR